MLTVLIAIVTGILVGKIASKRVLKINDKVFTILSTIFVFLMGISLGLSKAVFLQAQSLIFTTIIASLIFSLGSIFGVMILTKFIIKSNV